MTSRRKPAQTETATEAFDRNLAEALKLVTALSGHVHSMQHEDTGRPATPHWGHVGDLAEVVKNLRSAAHYAGIKGYVEE